MSQLGRTSEHEYVFAARERITVSSTAVGFTAGTFKPTTGDRKGIPAKIARCNVETDSIRYTQDGSTTPTASIGRIKYDTDSFDVIGTQAIQDFLAIRVTTDATLDVEYGW